MDSQLEKAKLILNKSFCFMESQEKSAKEKGYEVMEREDIEYLLSSNGIVKGEMVSLDGTADSFFSPMEKYKPSELFKVIKKAKENSLIGVEIIEKDITNRDHEKIREMGGYVEYTGHGSTTSCEIYFTEEAFIRSKISEFKNLFGCLSEFREFFN